MRIEYKNRMFGDVLREIIDTTSENSYTFVKQTGITNVMLSNFMQNKKYPGISSLRRIANVLPEEERDAFISYYHDPAVRQESVKKLKAAGIEEPYSYSSYDKEKTMTSKFRETDKERLGSLKVQGLFKYLTQEEKFVFKEMIMDYIVERNQAFCNIENKQGGLAQKGACPQAKRRG